MSTAATRPATLGIGEDDLVTGDAVALQLPTASPVIRVLSGFIDAVVCLVVLVAGFYALFSLMDDVDDALGAALSVGTLVTALVVLPVVVEQATGGRSLGRVITGTVLTRTDGGPVAWRQSVVRALVGVVEIWMLSGAPAIISVLVTRRSQRLGDLAAGTCLLRDRAPAPVPAALWPRPGLEQWVSTADIAPIPDGLARSARQLLQRRATLAPQARAHLAQECAQALAAYVAPPPPGVVAPEDYVSTVLAERARRDAARLSRDAELRHRLGLG